MPRRRANSRLARAGAGGVVKLLNNLRNIAGATEDLKRHGPSTPSDARFRQRVDYRSAWTFGVKGSW